MRFFVFSEENGGKPSTISLEMLTKARSFGAGAAVLSNAVDVKVEGSTVSVVNEIFGGTTMIETAFTGPGPYLVVVRPKSFTAAPGAAATPAVHRVESPSTGRAGGARIVSRHAEESQGPPPAGRPP